MFKTLLVNYSLWKNKHSQNYLQTKCPFKFKIEFIKPFDKKL